MPLNVANTITITAKTALANLTNVASNVISNAVNSNQIYKINNLMLTNYSALPTAANVWINRAGVGTFYVAGSIVVPTTSLLTVLGKDTAIYLEEGDTIQANTGSNNAIHLSIGYELLS